MHSTVFTQTLADILQPVQRPEDARQDAVRWSPNITVKAGDIIAIRTSTKLTERYAVGGADGTAVGVGLAMYSFTTDANGMVLYNDLTAPGITGGPNITSPIWIIGMFDPAEIKIAGVVAANFAAITTAFTANLVRQLHNGFAFLR